MFNMSEILEQIDWGSGFHLPAANAENQKLEAELKTLFVHRAKAKFHHDNALSQVEELRRHLSYIQLEAEQYQKLITTHTQQTSDEKHKLKTLQATKDNVNQEVKRMRKYLDEISERQNAKKAELSKNVVKLEKLKRETAWDVEALEAWETSLLKRNQDKTFLAKFAREDQSKANEFEAKRQHLQAEFLAKKALLEKTLGEVASNEQVVEKGGKIFKQQIEERFELIDRWKDAVRNLHQRDEDIDRANREIAMTLETIAKQEEALDDQNTFLSNEKTNNKIIEEQIAGLNTVASAKRKELSLTMHLSLTLTGQMNRLKRITHSSSHSLDEERKRRRYLEKSLDELQLKTLKTQLEIEEVKSKLEEIGGSSLTSAERLKRLEQIRDAAHKSTDGLLGDTEKAQCALHRAQVQLKQERDVTKVRQMQMSGGEMSAKLLTKRMGQCLTRLELHRELSHALDSKISEMQIKAAELDYQGGRDDVLSDEKENRIASLDQTLFEHTEVRSFLQQQALTVQEKTRKLRASIAEENSRLDTLRGKIREQELLVEGGTRQIAGAKLRAQTLQVDENVLRLKVSQINKSVSEENQSIYDLQKFKIEMETAQRERELEVETHREVLAARRKNLDEAKGRIKADIKQRLRRVEQFKDKYNSVLESLGRDEDGQWMSIVRFTVRNAQEKHLLQEEGDELDGKIRKAEREIVAIENTLKTVNKTNAVFKDNLSSINAGNAEGVEMKRLEQEIIKTSLSLRQAKQQWTKQRLHLQGLRETLQKLKCDEAGLGELLSQKRNERDALEKEKDVRQAKLRQAANLLHRKRNLKNEALKRCEANLRIQCLVECNEKALRKLVEFYTQNEEASDMIKQYLIAHKLYFNGALLSYSNRTSSSNSSASSKLSHVILSFSR